MMKNKYGITIVKCCASCKFREINTKRICLKDGSKVKGRHCCELWKVSPLLRNAGKGGGKVKKKSYLSFYQEKWIRQREGIIAGDIMPKDMLSVEQIRQQFQELYGSIYVNI